MCTRAGRADDVPSVVRPCRSSMLRVAAPPCARPPQLAPTPHLPEFIEIRQRHKCASATVYIPIRLLKGSGDPPVGAEGETASTRAEGKASRHPGRKSVWSMASFCVPKHDQFKWPCFNRTYTKYLTPTSWSFGQILTQTSRKAAYIETSPTNRWQASHTCMIICVGSAPAASRTSSMHSSVAATGE